MENSKQGFEKEIPARKPFGISCSPRGCGGEGQSYNLSSLGQLWRHGIRHARKILWHEVINQNFED